MALPKYNELYAPFLAALMDGNVHALKEIKRSIADKLCLSEEERSERLPSGRQAIFDNRMGWARTYLKKAGRIKALQRGYFSITDQGKELLQSGVQITNALLAEHFPTFAEFVGHAEGGEAQTVAEVDAEETPRETFDRVYNAINRQLADELLTEIMAHPAVFFENLVVDLMKAMDYGDGFVTRSSGDDGIDGIIHEDKLGFNLIYIQAKRWSAEKTVGKPEIQKFVGAMMGPPRIEKSLFITTARFSPGAKAYADAQHIILVDGKRLAELMIEYGLGVSTQKTYEIKRIDSDYFADE